MSGYILISMGKNIYHTAPTDIAKDFFCFKPQKTYQEKKLQKEYIREYHKNVFRKNPINKEYLDGLTLIRSSLKTVKGIDIWKWCELVDVTGCSLISLRKHLGLDNEYVLNEFRAGEWEIDHLVPASFFRDHPHLAPYMNRYYNLQIKHKSLNRSKEHMATAKLGLTKDTEGKKKIDWLKTSPEIVLIMTRIKLEYINHQIQDLI